MDGAAGPFARNDSKMCVLPKVSFKKYFYFTILFFFYFYLLLFFTIVNWLRFFPLYFSHCLVFSLFHYLRCIITFTNCISLQVCLKCLGTLIYYVNFNFV